MYTCVCVCTCLNVFMFLDTLCVLYVHAYVFGGALWTDARLVKLVTFNYRTRETIFFPSMWSVHMCVCLYRLMNIACWSWLSLACESNCMPVFLVHNQKHSATFPWLGLSILVAMRSVLLKLQGSYQGSSCNMASKALCPCIWTEKVWSELQGLCYW